MDADFDAAVARITEVVMFENWLRFYFIDEEDDTLVLKLPEKALEQIQKRYGNLHDLADRLNEREVDHQTSMNEVCLFVANDFSARGIPEEIASRVFDSPVFQLELQLFGSWVQSHEEQLDQGFMDFTAWQKGYREWRDTDEVREYSKKLGASIPTMSSNNSETTQ